MSTIDLTKLTVGQLKELAYDYIARKEEVDRALSQINGMISTKIQEQQAQIAEKAEEGKKEEKNKKVKK